MKAERAHFKKIAKTLWGIPFENPVGLAAGLDKDARCLNVWAAFGFGFVEVGTVTPEPQVGNPKPRLFRLQKKEALINRMGFNSGGVDAMAKRLEKRPTSLIVGVNIGKNKTTPLEKAADDYRRCMRAVYDGSDYLTVNISSPNTPGLRELQGKAYLEDLLSAVMMERDCLSHQYGVKKPIWVKVSPDLSEEEVASMGSLFLKYHVDGIVATNTTVDHSSVVNQQHGDEKGGLSGAPLAERSTKIIHDFHESVSAKIPIVGVGGILSVHDAVMKVSAGASLVQVYTGFVYKGPALIRDILSHL